MTTVGIYFRGLDKESVRALHDRLNAIAYSFGYYSERGPTAGQGNWAELLCAIDSGELALILLPDEHFAPAIAHLESLNEPWADSVAIGLRDALRRQAEVDQAEIDEYNQTFPVTDEELFNLFVAHGTTAAEIARMNPETLIRQIAEMRQDEPDDIQMHDHDVALAILRYARSQYPPDQIM